MKIIKFPMLQLRYIYTQMEIKKPDGTGLDIAEVPYVTHFNANAHIPDDGQSSFIAYVEKAVRTFDPTIQRTRVDSIVIWPVGLSLKAKLRLGDPSVLN